MLTNVPRWRASSEPLEAAHPWQAAAWTLMLVGRRVIDGRLARTLGPNRQGHFTQ